MTADYSVVQIWSAYARIIFRSAKAVDFSKLLHTFQYRGKIRQVLAVITVVQI